jgi:hypothetical protein
MTPEMIIAALVALVVALGVVALRLVGKRNALGARLAATTANLQKYTPLDEIDVEIARRQMTLQTETARANQAIEQARAEVQTAVANLRQEADAEQAGLSARLQLVREELARTQGQLAQAELQLDLEDIGFYEPKFHFVDARQYGDALDLVREAQKELVRQKRLLEEIEPDVPRAMRSLGRLAVLAFNGDAAAIVAGVGHENFEASKEKLRRRFEAANRLLEPAGLRIVARYLELKVKEMALACDHRVAEETAKRARAAVKDAMRKEEDVRLVAERSRRPSDADEPPRMPFQRHGVRVEPTDAPRPNGESRSEKH